MPSRSFNRTVLIDKDLGEISLVDSGHMAAIDHAASERFGITSPILMENAGIKALIAIQQEIWRRTVPTDPITILAGRGNNGGDALVMARQLHFSGAQDLTVVLSNGEPTSGSQCAVNLAMCRALGIEISADLGDVVSLRGWLIDGMTGTGLRGPLTGPPALLSEQINQSAMRVISLDAPSGVGDQFTADIPVVHADWTIALELPKSALYQPLARAACGNIIIVPIGFPKELTCVSGAKTRLLGPAAVSSLLPAVRPDAHKGVRGHVAVIAGSTGTVGAARLAATAAARSRAGVVTLHADAETYPIQAAALTSIMVSPWSEATDPAELLGRFDSIIVGPGWGIGSERGAWLKRLLEQPLRGVLDADAITLLGNDRSSWHPVAGSWVLTPHPGELSRALSIPLAQVLSAPVEAATELATRLGAVVVLKGHVTYVIAPERDIDEGSNELAPRLSVIDGLQPWLATGGSGDVLAGVIGGILAGGEITAYQAACAGVLIHAEAARNAYNARGWFISEDLLDWVSRLVDCREVSHDGC